MVKTITYLAFAAILLSISGCSFESLQISGPQDGNNHKILFQDDFSDPSTGWTSNNEKDLIMGFDNGRYRMWINRPDLVNWSLANLKFSDVRIEADVSRLGGPTDNNMGILCRYTDPGNFYGFLISSDGYYGISKRQDDKFEIIGTDGMKFSRIINLGNAVNHIQADCVGDTLTLSVNGVELVQAQDFVFSHR